MAVTFNGAPVTLLGPCLKPEEAMPDFTLADDGLNDIYGHDLSGIRVFLTVPSLDTGVCDQEVRKFNHAAAEYEKAQIYAVSLDLPFAQARWCGASGTHSVRTLSDYKDHSFGLATGTRIQELGLLTRAVFLVDGDGKIAYAEYVPEITEHPNYEAAFRCLRALCGD